MVDPSDESTSGAEKVLIATSIAPNGRIEVQRAAVASWLARGFRVVSLNTPREIDRLAPLFDGVQFEPQLRTAASLIGRPVIFVSDILHHLRASGAPTCGIVNSDILLTQTSGLPAQIAAATENVLVYGPRFEVASWDDEQGHFDPFGFDYFFFRPDLVRRLPESHFCLGMPFWDFWLPLSALFAGFGLTKIVSPVAKHIPHPTSRDESFMMFNAAFADFAKTIVASDPQSPLAQALERQLPAATWSHLAERNRADDAALPDGERLRRLTQLAASYDELTRQVIHFLDRHSARMDVLAR